MTLHCTNEDCDRYGVAIDNPFGYPPEAVVCVCGHALAPVDPEPEPTEAEGVSSP